MKKGILHQFKEGILTNNPTFVQLLGMCPTLATTTSVINAIGIDKCKLCTYCWNGKE